jgi:16S rRNA (guanine(966)-N(2))-methyltransferase RsmD
MWVTGGDAKGIRLKTLPSRSTRPTTSMVKQAIFSVLENRTTDWHRVLDLYAGTGALGIEALSRGAEWVDFVDQRKSCCEVIRANLEKVGGLDRAHVYWCSVNKAIGFLSNSYDIIFMDPPYADVSVNGSLGALARSNLPGENCTVVLCHANRLSPKSDYDKVHLIEQRRYGDTFVSIYQKESEL